VNESKPLDAGQRLEVLDAVADAAREMAALPSLSPVGRCMLTPNLRLRLVSVVEATIW